MNHFSEMVDDWELLKMNQQKWKVEIKKEITGQNPEHLI
jgi:hypothetical protein